MRTFPTVLWEKKQVTFLPDDAPLPPEMPLYAVLVFALCDSRFVVADISERGWCIPSGRLHSGETPEEAARREAWEESGATLGALRPLGHFLLTETETGEAQQAFAFLARARRLAPVPPGTESRGVRLLSLDELPRVYFRWDALMEAVFSYALEQSASLPISQERAQEYTP